MEDDTTIKTSSVADNKRYYQYLIDGVRRRGLTTLVNTLCYPTLTECERAHIEGAILAVEMPYWVPPTVSFDVIRLFCEDLGVVHCCVCVCHLVGCQIRAGRSSWCVARPSSPAALLLIASAQMETYSGWFDQEGHQHQTLRSRSTVVHARSLTLHHQARTSSCPTCARCVPQFSPFWLLFSHLSTHKKILETRNASLSIYMAYGGTNYGFSNGGDPPIALGPIDFTRYSPDSTTYDYDAPIHEAGQYHVKYDMLRALFTPYTGRNATVPAAQPIASYGVVPLPRWVRSRRCLAFPL